LIFHTGALGDNIFLTLASDSSDSSQITRQEREHGVYLNEANSIAKPENSQSKQKAALFQNLKTKAFDVTHHKYALHAGLLMLAIGVVGINSYTLRTSAAAVDSSVVNAGTQGSAISAIPNAQESMLLHLLDTQYDKQFNQVEESADTSTAYYYQPTEKTLASASNLAALGNASVQTADAPGTSSGSSAAHADKQNQVVSASVDQLAEKKETAPSILAAAGAIEKPGALKPQEPAKNDLFIFYEVQPGETLASIAAKFGLEEKTLIMEAQLPEDQQKHLKPGFVITIVPDNGVTARVQRGDTVKSLAVRYGVPSSVEQIMHDNELTSDADLQEGDLLFIKGGNKAIPKNAPVVDTTRLANNNSSTSSRARRLAATNDTPDAPRATTPTIAPLRGGSHSFPYGYCTWWVAKQVGGVPWGGNAKAWLANASAMGYPTGRTPRVGSIVVTTENRAFGHVAYVIGVKSGSFIVSEMNYVGFARTNTREISNSSPVVRGFIYY